MKESSAGTPVQISFKKKRRNPIAARALSWRSARESTDRTSLPTEDFTFTFFLKILSFVFARRFTSTKWNVRLVPKEKEAKHLPQWTGAEALRALDYKSAPMELATPQKQKESLIRA